MTIRLPQVFISYQRADEPFARQVREHLVSHGVQTWMDQYDIPVGAYWPDEIDRGLRASDIVIGILSPDSAESRNVKNEWDWALQRNTPLVLLMARPTEIPHRYVSINFIDATIDQWRALDVLLRSLGIEQYVDAPMMLPARYGARQVKRHYPSAPVLVGREREQASLGGLLERLAAGQGALALIGGEAGIGKTALTSWLGWAIEERGAVVCTGGCYDLTTTPPYGPWAEILRDWAAEEAGLPEVPVELRPGTGMGNIQSQTAFFDLAAAFLFEASQMRPLMVLLEDLHWADQASLDLLRYLARSVSDLPLLLVATYRDDELTRRHPLFQLLPTLTREPHTLRLALTRLDAEALRELVTNRYGLPAPDTDRMAAYVERLTEGNPFFAREVFHALEEAGALARDGDAWRLTRLEQIHVPTLVREVVESRLAHLGDDIRRQLEVASVIGHEVPLDLWVEVSGAGDAMLAEVLERAIDARLIEELPDRARFRFTHALVRETLYEGLVSLRLRSWHRAVAGVLLAHSRPVPDTVAHHLQQAGDRRAFDWLVQAGDNARAAYAWADAVDRYERALALLGDDPDRAQERGWLFYRIGMLLRGIAVRRSLPYLAAAAETAEQVSDRTLAAYARFAHGLVASHVELKWETLDELRAGARMVGVLTAEDLRQAGALYTTPFIDPIPTSELNTEELARVNLAGGTEVLWLAVAGEFAAAIDVGERFLAVSGTTSDRVPILHAMTDAQFGLGVAYAAMGKVAHAQQALDDALMAYLRFGHHFLARATTLIRGLYVLWPYLADDPVERAYIRDHARGMHENLLGLYSDGIPGMDTLIDDIYADRWDTLVQTMDAWRAIGLGYTDGWARSVSARIARHRGERAEAWQYLSAVLDRARGRAGQLLNYFDDVVPAELAAQLHLDAGDCAAAEPLLRSSDDYLRRTDAVIGRPENALSWSRYYQVVGDTTQSVACAHRALQHALEPRQPLALVAAHRQLGALLTADGAFDTASQHLHASLSLAKNIGIGSEIAWTQLALAELHAASGNAEMALTLLTDVRAVFEPLGAVPTLQRIGALESRIGSTT